MKKAFIFLICFIVIVSAVFISLEFYKYETVSTGVDEVESDSSLERIELSVTKLYSPSGEIMYVPSSGDISLQEKGWHTEPVSLMQRAGETKYVVASQMEAHRLEGWETSEYNDGLFSLGHNIKEYMKDKSGKWGMYIKNLENNKSLILNDGKYSSASIIKLYVMASLYSESETGNLIINDEIQKHLNDMITISDNYSSNYLVKTIGKGSYLSGFNTINANNSLFGCINTQHKSLFIGYGDYVAYGRNLVSPVDCGILLEKIYRRELVSPDASDNMLELLKNQTRRSKIPYYLPKDTVCANKTGETSDIESDVGIVYSPNCDYIICIITNDSDTAIYDIRQISLMTYNYFNPPDV